MTRERGEHARFGDCRGFLRQLAEHAESGAAAPDCPACAARLAAARAHLRLLRGMPAPAVPVRLGEASFFEEILEDALEVCAAPLEPTLRAGLPPVTAPRDAVWEEVAEPPEMSPGLRALLPARRAPAWLWTRILADLREERSRQAMNTPRRRPLLRAGLAAALLIGATFMLLHSPVAPAPNGGAGSRGAAATPEFVWVDLSEEPDPSLSPESLVLELAR